MKLLHTTYTIHVVGDPETGSVSIMQDDPMGDDNLGVVLDKALVPLLVDALRAAAKEAGE